MITMNKLKLQEKIIEKQQLLISELKEKIATSLSMVDIDESDTIDPEDLSHQSESLEMKNLFEQKYSRRTCLLLTVFNGHDFFSVCRKS